MITSLCPPKYLVTECITISAPSAKGFCKKGEANVLSTAQINLFAFAIFAQASISIICMVGLVGVSSQIIFVFALMYFEMLLASFISMK